MFHSKPIYFFFVLIIWTSPSFHIPLPFPPSICCYPVQSLNLSSLDLRKVILGGNLLLHKITFWWGLPIEREVTIDRFTTIPHQQWSDIYFRIFAASAYSMHVQVRYLCNETSDYSDISKIRSLITQWFDLCSEDVRKKLLKCMIGLNYNGWGSKAHWIMESKDCIQNMYYYSFVPWHIFLFL